MQEGVQIQRKPATKRQVAKYCALVMVGDPVSFMDFFNKHLGVDFDPTFNSLGQAQQDWVVRSMLSAPMGAEIKH